MAITFITAMAVSISASINDYHYPPEPRHYYHTEHYYVPDYHVHHYDSHGFSVPGYHVTINTGDYYPDHGDPHRHTCHDKHHHGHGGKHHHGKHHHKGHH